MARFQLPLIFDLSVRDNSLSMSKATYMQNWIVKSDITPKLINRNYLQEGAGIDAVARILAIHEKPSDGVSGTSGKVLLVGAAYSDGKLNLYEYTPATGVLASLAVLNTTSQLGAQGTVHMETIYQRSAADFQIFIQYNVGSTVAGDCAWVYSNSGVSNASIDAGYPVGVFSGEYTKHGAASLDSYVFVLSSLGRIYNSDVGAPTSWNALGYITPNEVGTPVRIVSYKNHIVCFGTDGIEFFYNANGAAPGSPLLPRKDLKLAVGVMQGGAGQRVWAAKSREYIAFLGTTPAKVPFVGIIENFGYRKISNPAVDQILQAYGGIAQISGASFRGEECLVVSLYNSLRLMYQFSADKWSLLSSSLLASTQLLMDSADAYNATTGKSYKVFLSCLNAQGGGLEPKVVFYDSSSDTAQDVDKSGTTYAVSCVVQAPRYRGEPGQQANRKFMNKLWLIGDTLTSAATLSLTYSDDDYQTSSTSRTFDLTSSLKQLTRLGQFRERAFNLTYSGTQTFRCEALEGEYHMGTN